MSDLAENIIGEESFENPVEFVERMVEEAERIWTGQNWHKESHKNGVLIESKPVSGAFADSGILMMRCLGRISGNAKQIFEFLTSPEGFAMLDPVSKPEDHTHSPIEGYDWKPNARLEVALANVNMPLMPKTEFLVLNAIDYENLTFVSKSIIHPKHPGSSIYYEGSEEYAKIGNVAKSPIRSLNTMAIRLRELSNITSELLVLNYVDMGVKRGKAGWVYNLINRKFFGPLYKRIEKRFSSEKIF